MDSWMYYVIIISWAHCKLYSWFAVAMDPDTTTDVYTPGNQGNHSSNVSMQATGRQTTPVSLVTLVMPSCPPPGNLHLLCDVTLAGDAVTCQERAHILRHCYNKHSGIYNDSDWSVCLTHSNLCADISSFLRTKQLIPESTTKHHISSFLSTFPPTSIVPSAPNTTHSETSHIPTTVIDTNSISATNTTKSETDTTDIDTKDTPTTKGVLVGIVTLKSKSNTVTVLSGTTMTSLAETQATAAANENISTVGTMSSDGGGQPAAMSDELSTYSYIYPLVGTLVILIEVLILIYLFCCIKKKTSPSRRKYKSDSLGSMILQEEAITAESQSPTKALYSNAVYDEEAAMREDEKIFNSYLNLQFIDDSSVDGTPEKVILVT